MSLPALVIAAPLLFEKLPIYVAKNDGLLLGALRELYACKLVGNSLACTPAGNP